jgi:hypothetical protein
MPACIEFVLRSTYAYAKSAVQSETLAAAAVHPPRQFLA